MSDTAGNGRHADGDISVLVADDDEHMRAALASLIEAEPGMRLVGTADDALAAIRCAEGCRPDVALMDVNMPRGGGVRATEEIRRRVPGCRVIALSAAQDRDAVLEMVGAGAAGYLVKGGAIGDIVEAVRRAAAGEATLSVQVAGQVVDELAAELHARRRHQREHAAERDRIRALVADETRRETVLQPICCLRSGAAVGYEALTRFGARPRRSPDAWFATAHRVGLGPELERAALRAALRRLDDLPAGTFLSVNGSPEVFAEEETHALLADAGLERAVLEITEHAPVADYAQLAARLGVPRGGGARLAVDDAGAGFASLRHILQLAPDFIKLDRSLVAGIGDDPGRQALAEGLISFAARMDVAIVAEGIERPDELRMLRELGVQFGQGYLLARPSRDPVDAAAGPLT